MQQKISEDSTSMCWPLVCATQCTYGTDPKLCSCNGKEERADPNLPVRGQCQLTKTQSGQLPPKIFQIRQSVWHFGYCLVDLKGTLENGNPVGLGNCSAR
jgi:hypothetical protein